MACYHPSEVSVRRKAPPGYPALLRTSEAVTVPCGNCLGCRSDQARSWAIRLLHESEYPPRPAWFATLTYSPEEMPDNGTLDPVHPTLFLKRLRRALPDPVSYYLCGEYGDRTQRPHYHAVLFGPAFLDRVESDLRHGAPVYRSAQLERAWKHGLCEITGLTYAGARYVAGYVRKKVRQADSPEHYDRYDPETGEIVTLQREYGRMSRRPAIALRWIERYWRDVYPADFVPVDGSPLKPPRYYDRWMDQKHDPEKQHRPCSDCREHQEVMYNVRRQRIEDAVELDDAKLIMKEKIHRAKVALFQTRDAI